MVGTSNYLRFNGDPTTTSNSAANTASTFLLGCFADPDGVIRRGMSAYVPTSTTPASTAPTTAGAASSIPLAQAYSFNSSSTAVVTAVNQGTGSNSTLEQTSRPVMLNRPFRSVAELDYVFSDTPWRNLDMSTPESGNVGLLDLFCINDTEDPNGLVAGKIDLNTRQTPVLQAILAGAYEDELAASTATSSLPLSRPLNRSSEEARVPPQPALPPA